MISRLGALALAALLLVAAPSQAQTARFESLTLEQRVAQMFVVNLYGQGPTISALDFLRHWQPGGVALFSSNAGNPQQVTELTNAYQEAITGAGGVPLLIAVDQEGGVVTRLTDGFTQFPAPMLITATGDLSLAESVGRATADELRAVGVNMNLAPVADLETNSANPIIRRRAFGSDPALTAPFVASVVRGLQEGGVLATVKHFPGHGDTSEDSHLGLPVVRLSRERLETVELVPFKAALDAGVEAVLVAHIWYPALEPQENMPASLSHAVVTGLLREDMRLGGLIMTDALDMDAIDTVLSPADAAVRAVQAGVDLVAIGAHVGPEAQAEAIQVVVDAVRRGDISEARINASVQRILDAKARYGILDWEPLDSSSAPERVNAQGHAALVEDLFRAGVTVIYDQNHAIPIGEAQTVALIYPATRPSIREECSAFHANVHAVGVSETPQDEEIAWAVDAAQEAEHTVVFTLNAVENSRQQSLVQALPSEKTIAVALWSPYDWLAFPEVSAYVASYSPLPPAIPAVCAMLFGAAPARGQLPVTLSEALPAGTRSPDGAG